MSNNQIFGVQTVVVVLRFDCIYILCKYQPPTLLNRKMYVAFDSDVLNLKENEQYLG